MLPFIQCHHTRGLAEFGGFLNPSSKEAGRFCAMTDNDKLAHKISKDKFRALRAWLIGDPLLFVL
jgi:hypothetical protein